MRIFFDTEFIDDGKDDPRDIVGLKTAKLK